MPIYWISTVGWLCWGLTSQSTIFQSCRDGAIASWVINQYFRGVKCLAQGHNTAAVGLEPRTSRSGVRHSTTEPPRSPEYRRTWLNSFSLYRLLFTSRLTLPDRNETERKDQTGLISNWTTELPKLIWTVLPIQRKGRAGQGKAVYGRTGVK